MKLDRELQRAILLRLRDVFPALDVELFNALAGNDTDRENAVGANLFYLMQHGLVENNPRHFSVSRNGDYGFSGVRISAQGLDFLEEDGGLSSILGVVTIKLHDDTIKSLIESRIRESDLPQPEKQRYIDQLRELPAETTKHLVLKLVDLGLEKGPAAIAVIGTWLKSAGLG